MTSGTISVLALVSTLALTGAVAAAAPPPRGQPAGPTAAELLARLEEQQREIEAQRERLAAQAEEIAAQHRRLEEMGAALQELARRLAEQSTAAPPALEERLSALEQSAKQKPELPEEMVTAGDFPGSIRIPGRSETFKIGGLARTSLIQTFAPLGSDDRFLTHSIPVGEETVGQTTRFQTSVRPSRLNFEFRTPTSGRPLRAFIEGDFAAPEGNFLRLRHAYMQFKDYLAGQTWLTFSDPEAEPEDLDFEGINALNVLRQTQLRWTPRVGPFSRLAIALEDADASITGGTGANRWPDLILGRRLRSDAGHLFVALSLRDVRGQLTSDPTSIDEAVGWALTVSGTHAARRWSAGDRWLYQVTAGEGSARYINDLNALGGQDAVFDEATGKLRALPAAGGYLAYEHHWRPWRWFENVRSSAIAGFVYVDNLEIQPADAYHRTGRYSLNLVGSPFPAMDIGVQFVNGRRVNKDGKSGASSQFQLMAQYRF